MPNSSTPQQIADLCQSAADASSIYAEFPAGKRAEFLEMIARKLEENATEIVGTASRETNLPAAPRLSGELARTCAQFRMFADLIRSNEWLDVRIVLGDANRKPAPKPELRRTQVPLGPVAVFGASNFPLAYSVTGGDTASALAAGCPVVVKAHPAHPETTRLTAEIIRSAVEESGLPAGVFGIVWGGTAEGVALVNDPRIEAVGFTGSLKAGRALFDLAAARPRPIPVFAEMGSINPVFLLPGALVEGSERIARGFVESLTASVGQFCTNPGVVVGLESPEFSEFIAQTAAALSSAAPQAMLTEGISTAYTNGVKERSNLAPIHVECTAAGTSPALFSVKGSDFIADKALHEELFGPSAVAVRCASFEELVGVAKSLVGQLSATVHFADIDREDVRILLPLLTRIAGRIVANGFPTGVEVNAAQTHGGPYPATTDSRTTSVGTAAINRFVRPVTYQNFPSELLPLELR
jgi:NADP-dependent aldehyde dehydrogenase